jgi:hypothetical protein
VPPAVLMDWPESLGDPPREWTIYVDGTRWHELTDEIDDRDAEADVARQVIAVLVAKLKKTTWMLDYIDEVLFADVHTAHAEQAWDESERTP